MPPSTFVAMGRWYEAPPTLSSRPASACYDAARRLEARGFATRPVGRASLRVYRPLGSAADGLEATIRIQYRTNGRGLQVRYRHDVRLGFFAWLAVIPFFVFGWFFDGFHRRRLATQVHRILATKPRVRC